MMGYKDQTWCASDCVNTKCFRNFTATDRADAVKWWGDENFPITVSDYKPMCDFYKAPEVEDAV